MSFYTPPSEMTDEQLEYWASQPSSMDIMQEHLQAQAISAELRRRRMTPEEREQERIKNEKIRTKEKLDLAKRKIEELIPFAEVLSVPRSKPAKVTPTEELYFDRQVVEGNIVSVKMKETQYGATNKMLVQLDNGNRVYGSVPKSINEKLFGPIPGQYKYGGPFHTVDEERLARMKQTIACGRRVRFLAMVDPSNDDPHFGFFSRPSRAELV